MSERFERAFRVAFDRSTNPMALYDDERRVLEANAAAGEMLGVAAQTLRDTRLDDWVPEADHADLRSRWTRFLDEGAQSGTMRMRTAAGTDLLTHYHREAEVLPHVHLGVLLEDPEPVLEEDELSQAGRQPLTARETEVVGLVALGLSGEEIGQRLHISPETVRTHVRNAMDKQEARNRAHLIALAMRHGVIDPG